MPKSRVVGPRVSGREGSRECLERVRGFSHPDPTVWNDTLPSWLEGPVRRCTESELRDRYMMRSGVTPGCRPRLRKDMGAVHGHHTFVNPGPGNVFVLGLYGNVSQPGNKGSIEECRAHMKRPKHTREPHGLMQGEGEGGGHVAPVSNIVQYY